jgi:hypothetical protein
VAVVFSTCPAARSDAVFLALMVFFGFSTVVLGVLGAGGDNAIRGRA